MLNELKEKVLRANLELYKSGLVLYTWGNVSEIDPQTGLVVIKPSGVSYEGMKAADMVVVDLDGRIAEGELKPSSDTPTHLELYRAHPEIKGIVHTHSTYATAFAQAGKSIAAYGTTHADYFFGDIPCSRELKAGELNEYERNTGAVVNELLAGLNALDIPGCLVKNHGPFAWGTDSLNAVFNAVVLEQVARLAYLTETLNAAAPPLPKHLLEKHYNRKHGKNAYYGQPKKK